ncbi:hypothetical protein RRG08_037400 [Elysia crispata]|uniref:Uncharacterized protein n=1 Tax=Elysia crispata TaxID=231223 RepID=A0AAE1AFH4_9GAST|nr:hypothetical protein RRG08_037400 [Elysia crispata]
MFVAYEVADTYSFLPREAVTRFLMSCSDCQKRMHLSAEANNNLTSASLDEQHRALSPDASASPEFRKFHDFLRHSYSSQLQAGGKSYMISDQENIPEEDSVAGLKSCLISPTVNT